MTGCSEEQIALVEAYAKANKLWGDTTDPNYVEPQYSEYLELDLGTVVPSIAGPKRPQDRIKLSESKAKFVETLPAYETDKTVQEPVTVSTDFRGEFDITNGDVAIASITSCTNTSQSVRDDRSRSDCTQRACQGFEAQAVGQDLARTGLPGCGRLS